MNSVSRFAAFAGGAGSFAVALAHGGMILVGAPAYEFFRAGDAMAGMARSGSVIPGLLTAVIVAVFIGFASVAVVFTQKPDHPWLRRGMLAIGLIYSLRGAALLAQIPGWFPESEPRDLIFSGISMIIGLLYVFAAAKKASA